MHWLKNYGFGSHLIDWLSLPIVIVLTLAVRIGVRNVVVWWLDHKRRSTKGERDYWRMHGEE